MLNSELKNTNVQDPFLRESMHFYRRNTMSERHHLKMSFFKKHVFLRIINPPAQVRHAPGIGPKVRQHKENPGPTPLPGKRRGGTFGKINLLT
jgi:hypothetical protein